MSRRFRRRDGGRCQLHVHWLTSVTDRRKARIVVDYSVRQSVLGDMSPLVVGCGVEVAA